MALQFSTLTPEIGFVFCRKFVSKKGRGWSTKKQNKKVMVPCPIVMIPKGHGTLIRMSPYWLLGVVPSPEGLRLTQRSFGNSKPPSQGALARGKSLAKLNCAGRCFGTSPDLNNCAFNCWEWATAGRLQIFLLSISHACKYLQYIWQRIRNLLRLG
jgi:hypothetical protein